MEKEEEEEQHDDKGKRKSAKRGGERANVEMIEKEKEKRIKGGRGGKMKRIYVKE